MEESLFPNLVIWYVVFLFSTSLHEASHAYAALRGGDYTAYQGGQVTLNPVPHIQRSPIGMVVIPLLTFYLAGGGWMIGWASAPFNPYWAARYPVRSFVMSLAGPLSHLIPVTVSIVGIIIGTRTGFFANGTYAAEVIARFLSIALLLNLVLLVFNLLPLPPLDGSEFWYLFVKREEDRLRWRGTANSYTFVGMMLAWWLFPYVFFPVQVALFLILPVLAGGPIKF